MADHLALNQRVVVRVHVPQPKNNGQVGEWLNPIDCKSITQRVTLVRI